MIDNEIQEWERCKEDIVYFVNTYCANCDFELYPFQEEILTENLVLATTSRQIGFTLTAQLKILHDIIFKQDKIICVMASNLESSLDFIKNIIILLDFCNFNFKPKLDLWDKINCKFDNGMFLKVITSKHSLRGYNINSIYIQDVEFIDKNIVEEFIEYVLPTVLSGKEKKNVYMWSSLNDGLIMAYLKTRLEPLGFIHHYLK